MLIRSLHRLAVVAVATVATALAGAAVAPAAQALPTVDRVVDDVLTATGEPGPHRLEGQYFTSPGVPAAAVDARPSILVGPSTPLIVGPSVCTTTAAGYDGAGNAVAVTAGHCGTAGDEVRSADDPEGAVIGTFQRNGAVDNGVILLNDRAQVTSSYNTVLGSAGGPLPAAGAQVCKTGIATGTSCGPALATSGSGFGVHLCASHGDSGAPVYAGGRLVGLLSGGFAGLPSCRTPLQGPVHSPVLAVTWDAVAAEMNAAGGVGAGFRLA
ncbi:S1 family peptidase [Corynebacterium sp.]|uniref:S1 family peptidase n=1 Tax=Corynebacterium sp. TaxID=1720 RepID=UPI003B3B0FBB